MSDGGGTAETEFWGTADDTEACRQYRTLVNAVEDGIYQLDAAGRFVAVNDAIVEATGYPRDALLGEHVSRLVAEDDVERIEREIAARLEAGRPRVETFELSIRTADGGTVPCELRMSLLVERGSLRGTVGVVRDVRDRERAGPIADHSELERELRERERRLSSLIDNVPGMVYRCRNDRDWPVAFVSDACEDVTGYAAEALERGDVNWGADVMVQADREAVWEAVQREAGEDGTFAVTYRIETATGERRWVSDRGRGIFEDGELVEIEGIISDITDRKRAERRLAEERDMFADGPAVVFRWEPDDEAGWPVEYVSPNVEDVFGYAPAELESGTVPYTDLLFEEEVDRIAREVEANSDGTTERFSHEPYRVRTNGGEVRWVKDTTKIVRDDSGEITNYLGYLVDITERKERERELQRYETVVETVNDGVYVVDDEGRFTMVNDAYVEMTGYDRDDLIGAHVSLVVDQAVAERAQVTEAEMRHGGSNGSTVEAELRRADGERLPSEATFALLASPDEPDRRVGVVRDISDRRERERELRRKERRYEAVFEDPNILVGLLDPDGTVLDINGTAMEYVDAALADVTGEPFWETPWWGGQAGVQSDVREWTERAADGEYVDFEADLIRPGGDRYTLSGYFRPVTDEDGEVVSIIVSDRDVTERKEREQALQESRNQLRALIDVLPVAVFVAEADGEIVEWNEAAEAIWGGEVAESESVAEYEAYDAWWADTGEPVEPHEWPLARALRGEEVTDPDEIEIEGFDGERRIVLNHGTPVRNADGEVTRAVVTLVDITERKEYQRRLEASNERLEQFAYAASHDLQEPLRMVSSYLQLLERRYGDELDADGREFVEFAVDGAERMREMIDALLEYSRVETKGEPFEPVDLQATLDDVLDDLRLQIEESDAEITSESLPRVEGDASQLRQLFQNLLDNAIEYSGDEPPRIHVGAERDGDRWQLTVSDRGIGIDPDYQDDIFEVFNRLHGRDEHAGMGIGLALCQRIVERHDGKIRVDSDPGEGTTFTVTLPAAGEPQE
ncbi:PAS domain S-box protein [Halovivax limisalsi]|uniref:PAS domain S-box protein n=1 Tax=Halovivax limisalsi TaxID=1453760 RepID=UPI001FFC5329|nr:PAS domain S-box protein [Halovivax limisalsi]